MTLTILDGPVIAAGESLSDALDVSMGSILRITTPLGWTPAPVTFQISTDGQGYNDLFTPDGEEVSIVCNGLNRAIIVPKTVSKPIGFIKFRSGTTMRPVKQEAQRQFAVAVKTAAPAPPSAWRPNLTEIPGLLYWFDPTDPARMSLDPTGRLDLFI
ncbi:MAG TPA: hypothetical protein VGJ75_03900, partial [Dongiaceae bacterium]